jgi:flagellar protein FliL
MPKKVFILATVVVAFVGGVGAGTLYWRTAGPADRAKSTARVATHVAPPKVAYVEIKELTLRLSDPSEEHYIKLTPVLAVREKSTDEVSAREPVIRDHLVTLISARSSSELTTPQGELQLKRDILDTLRNDFGDEVVAVYFSGYLVE